MKLRLIVFILISGLFGYSGYWFYISGNTDIYLDMAKEDLARHGVTFEYSSYEVSGFPYRLVLVFENPNLKYQNGALDFELKATEIEAIAQPWNFDHVILFPKDALIQLGFSSDPQIMTTLKPTTIGLSINSIGNGNYRVSSEMKGIEIVSDLALIGFQELPELSFHLRKSPQSTTEDKALLEPKLLELAFSGTSMAETPFQFNFSFRGQDVPQLTTSGLEQWRDQGGTFEIDQLQLGDVQGSGSLTLDEALRPLGAINLEAQTPKSLVNFFKTLTLVETGTAQNMLNFLEAFTASNQNQPVSFGLTLQNGWIYAGPIQLGELSPIIQE